MVLVMPEMSDNWNWEKQNSGDTKIEDVILVAASLVLLNLASLGSPVISASCRTLHVIYHQEEGGRWERMNG